MKKYTFEISQTDRYFTEITIEAESEGQAQELIRQELDACPLDTRSNTLQSGELDIVLKD